VERWDSSVKEDNSVNLFNLKFRLSKEENKLTLEESRFLRLRVLLLNLNLPLSARIREVVSLALLEDSHSVLREEVRIRIRTKTNNKEVLRSLRIIDLNSSRETMKSSTEDGERTLLDKVEVEVITGNKVVAFLL